MDLDTAEELRKYAESQGHSYRSDRAKVSKGWTTARTDQPIIMFPTSHDIDSRNVDEYIAVAKEMMDTGRIILNVNKAFSAEIIKVCDQLRDYRDRFYMRFTITLDDQNILNIWELLALSYQDRLVALKYAYHAGYFTSVSIDPMLSDPGGVIQDVSPYVRGTIWLGPIDKPIKYRDQIKFRTNVLTEINRIHQLYTRDNIKRIIDQHRENDKIYWKTHIFEIMFSPRVMYLLITEQDLVNLILKKNGYSTSNQFTN